MYNLIQIFRAIVPHVTLKNCYILRFCSWRLQTPGLVNVDFADVRAIMSNSGTAMLGVGSSSGKNRAEEAAVQAASAPLIERSIEQATGIVYNITGGSDLTLQEVNTVSEVCTHAFVTLDCL